MTIQNPAIIPPRVDLIDPRTGKIAREWYLYLVNLTDIIDPYGPSADDIGVQVAFSNDNTSEVAELAKEIANLSVGETLYSAFDTTGTVRYVSATAPSGVLGVSGVPYQEDGAITFAWSGTSGGVPYFSGTTSMASSALLSQYGVMVGGGAGSPPATVTVGTDNQFLAGATSAAPAMRAIRMDDVPQVLGFAARH